MAVILRAQNVDRDDRHACGVGDRHLREEDRAVELARYADDVVLGDQPLGRRRALLGHAARVLIEALDRPPEHAALGVDLLDGELGRILHERTFGVPAGRRQGTDPTYHDRLRRLQRRSREL